MNLVPRPASRRVHLFAASAVVFLLLADVWFISAGTWWDWRTLATYNYFDSLATAFLQGHNYLDDRPSSELLALEDPYRLSQRKGVPYLMDASFFEGKYYLYWGPAPALMLVGWKWLAPGSVVGDQYLVFLFLSGLQLILASLTTRIWIQRFNHLPAWTLVFGVLSTGFAPPVMWMLNNPEVHEAAISAGQFFLVAGILFAALALERRNASRGLLLLAAICWSISIASRVILGASIACLTILLLLVLYKRAGGELMNKQLLQQVAVIALPLVVAVAGLLWYNHARFGSIFEFGFHYVLGGADQRRHASRLYSGDYIRPNFVNYLSNPFQTTRTFPWALPRSGVKPENPESPFPNIYHAEAVTGLLYLGSFQLFAMAVLGLGRRQIRAQGSESTGRELDDPTSWLIPGLAGAAAAQSIPLLAFFYATMRYLGDLMPVVSLLAVLGFWEGWNWIAISRRRATAYAVTSIFLGVLSMILTLLLSISSYQDRFLVLNPSLLEGINRLLSP